MRKKASQLALQDLYNTLIEKMVLPELTGEKKKKEDESLLSDELGLPKDDDDDMEDDDYKVESSDSNKKPKVVMSLTKISGLAKDKPKKEKEKKSGNVDFDDYIKNRKKRKNK